MKDTISSAREWKVNHSVGNFSDFTGPQKDEEKRLQESREGEEDLAKLSH